MTAVDPYYYPLGSKDVNEFDGLVVGLVDADGKPVPIRDVKMKHHDVSDWHGPATVALPASMPKEEVERRLAIVRAVHDPDTSMEACCVRKRAMLAGTDAPPSTAD